MTVPALRYTYTADLLLFFLLLSALAQDVLEALGGDVEERVKVAQN